MASRPTASEARFKRAFRRAVRQVAVAERREAAAAHRARYHTTASHLHHMGLCPEDAVLLATGLRPSIKRAGHLGLRGFAARDLLGGTGRRRCIRYTLGQVIEALTTYRPRKETYLALQGMALELAA